MTVDFADYFWGDKNNGFDVLYHNMKHGVLASKELADFLRERSFIEENNYKLLSKVAKQASNSNSSQGTFAPLWAALRSAAEKLAGLHLQLAQKVAEIIKDVSKYSDELHKRHKAVKEEESSTLDVVQSIQSVTITLQKAKDTCMQRGLELEKLKKDNASQKELEKSEVKFKKAQDDYKTLVDKYTTVRNDFESKMTQACRRFQDVEETHLKSMKEFLNTYADILQANHEQVGQVHIDFKRQCLDMTVEKLLEQFVQSKYTGFEKPGVIEYDEVLSSITEVTNQTSQEKNNEPLKEVNKGTNGETGVAGNLDAFKKGHGVKREGFFTSRERSKLHDKEKEKQSERENYCIQAQQSKASRRTTSLLNLFMSNSQERPRQAGSGSAPVTPQGDMCPAVATSSISRNPLRGSKWFLRSRREKRKEKKANKKKKESVETTSNKEEKSDLEEKDQESVGGNKSATGTPTSAVAEVDEDGYCIKPTNQSANPWENSRDNFYSSSDSDSDSTETRERKIRVEIKPLGCNGGAGPMSASVDELRATVVGLSLGAPPCRRGSSHDGPPPTVRAPSAPVTEQLQQQQAAAMALQMGSMKRSQSVQSSQQPPGHQGDNLFLGLLGGRGGLVSPPPPSSTRSARFLETDPFGESAMPEAPALPPKLQQHGNIAIPRPPSRRGDALVRGRLSPAAATLAAVVATAANTSGSPSPATISRADSAASLEFRGIGVVPGVSRGPSPLTIGLADSVPLAVAFHEIAHAYFRGSDESRCQVKLVGDMMLSFPAGIVGVLASHPSPSRLSFKLRNGSRLERLVPNSQLVSASAADPNCFEFNMSALTALLRRQAELNPQASYFNVDIIKYQVRARDGAGSCPLQLVAYWKCNASHTDLKVDYKYNGRAMAAPNSLLNVQLSVPIDGGFKSVQSQPNAQWLPESNRLIWMFTELSQLSENGGVGSLKARVELSNGPGNQGTIFTKFNCEGATLSGVDFDLVGPGYRVSLVKKRFISGKYLCDGDVDLRTRYAAPPNIE